MIRAFLRSLFRAFGWKADTNLPASAHKKCVMIAAPHTHLLDGLITQAGFDLCGVRIQMAIADKYAIWPIKPLMESLGCLWIDRSKRKDSTRPSYTEAMVNLFHTHDKLCLVVAPEGTRSLAKHWKTGFYHIASQAGVPICLGYLDFDRKLAGVGAEVWPSGDMDADMKKIMAFYETIAPCYPEKFSIDTRYRPDS